MPPRLVGTITFTALSLSGLFELGRAGGIALSDLAGRGELRAELCAGPLRIPIRASLAVRRRGQALVLRPRRMIWLWLLAPFLQSADTGAAWSLAGGEFRLDLARATGGRIKLAGNHSNGADLPPSIPSNRRVDGRGNARGSRRRVRRASILSSDGEA